MRDWELGDSGRWWRLERRKQGAGDSSRALLPGSPRRSSVKMCVNSCKVWRSVPGPAGRNWGFPSDRSPPPPTSTVEYLSHCHCPGSSPCLGSAGQLGWVLILPLRWGQICAAGWTCWQSPWSWGEKGGEDHHCHSGRMPPVAWQECPPYPQGREKVRRSHHDQKVAYTTTWTQRNFSLPPAPSSSPSPPPPVSIPPPAPIALDSPLLSLFSVTCVCAESLTCVWLFVTPWTEVCQTSLSIEFSRQKYWSGLSFLPPGNHPDPGIEPMSPALAGGVFTTELPGKPLLCFIHIQYTWWQVQTAQKGIFFKGISLSSLIPSPHLTCPEATAYKHIHVSA